ncbi:MAG: hypothetical protein PHX08_22610 [Lachnospiraceae bacterium]|nr:hypothetical protein [Lachnospiraceae bacterium]
MMSLKKKWKDITLNVSWWEWTIILIALLLPLISFLYEDTNSIIRCGIDVLKSICEGRFSDYYNFSRESRNAGLMIHPPTYDYLFYLTVGIWEIPVAIIELVTGKTLENSLLMLCYSKCILVLFLILSAWIVYKIAREVGLTEKIATWAAFMFMTSGFVFANVCIAGQYDILGIFFTLLGVYFYTKGNMKGFTLLFAIAIQFKFFPLFIFIPLLLLKEKNLIKIGLHMICAFIPIMIMRLPFINNTAAMLEKNEIQADMIDRMFRNRIPIFETEVPLSLLLMGVVCLFCYIKDLKESEQKYYSVFIPFLAMAALFLSFPFYPYWIMYMAPWIPILFFMRKDKSDRRYLIEIGMEVSILFAQFSHFYWVYEMDDNAFHMFLDKVVFAYDKLSNPITLSNFNSSFPMDEYQYLLYGMYIVCLVALIALYWPKQEMEQQTDIYPCRWVAWIRAIIFYGVGALPFLLYLASILRTFI